MVSFPNGVLGRALAAQRFSCTFLRSLGSLFCYIIKGKQLQKSLNLSSRRPEITWAGGLSTVAWGSTPFNPQSSLTKLYTDNILLYLQLV